MATVIDSLVVLLGLDASSYKKGREQAEKETKETARVAKGSANEITKSLTEVGKTIAGLFLGFESATGFAKFLGNLNAGEAALGRTAANLNMGVHELNRWGAAVTLAGGSAADVQSSFTHLTDEAQKFFVTGEASPLINTLRQYGVEIKGANGQLRDQGDIFEELADKTAVYGKQYQNFALKQAGITQGEINYLVKSKQERTDLLRLAERDNAVTEESVRKAEELQTYWRNVGLQIEAAGQTILSAITPALEQVLKVFGDVDLKSDQFATSIKLIGSAALIIKNIFATVGDDIGNVLAALNAALHGNFKEAASIWADGTANIKARDAAYAKESDAVWNSPAGKAAAAIAAPTATAGYTPPPGSRAARFNNPGNILDAQGNERRYASPEEGQAALEKDLRIKMARGLKTVDAIINAYEGGDNVRNNIPAYIADVRKRLGKNELSEADIKALSQAIAIHESGPTPALAAGSNTNVGGATTVTIGEMNINAPSADPRAVAEQVPAAIQRKFSVTQADTGQS